MVGGFLMDIQSFVITCTVLKFENTSVSDFLCEKYIPIHGRFTLNGQIFNSHILVVVKIEDLKWGY